MEYYVVAIDSYDGDSTRREQFTWSEPDRPFVLKALYAIVRVGESSASLVDDGYRSREEAVEAWPEAK